MSMPTDDYPKPWKVGPLARVMAANGALVAICIAFDERTGVRPEANDHASLIVESVNGKATDVADPLAKLQEEVTEWADAAFPDRIPAQAFMKLFEELGEVIRNPTDALEWADVFIMLVDLAKMHGVTALGEAVRRKLVINRARQWDVAATGVMKRREV